MKVWEIIQATFAGQYIKIYDITKGAPVEHFHTCKEYSKNNTLWDNETVTGLQATKDGLTIII